MVLQILQTGVEPNITLLYIVLGYLGLMLVVGFWAYQKTETAEDFMLAGRSLGALIIAGTLMATWMGSGSVTGGGNSIAYSNGIWVAMLFGTAALIGIAILKLFASQIRGFGTYTIPEILEEGIGNEAKVIGLLVIAFAYVGIVSYQFTGFGFILAVTTGLPVETGTLIAAVVIIALATMGGLISVAYTDAISAFLMLIGLIIGLPFVLSAAGGWGEITTTVPESSLTVLGDLSPIQFLGLWVPPLLLVMADQNMYQRLIAGKSDEGTGIGVIGWFIGVAVAGVIIPIIAFAARSMFPDIDPGMALISVTTVIPTWVGGILLAAAAAFIITTGNSFLLSASTNISQDLYKGFINPEASDRAVLWLTRGAVVVLGILSYVLGQYFPTILELQLYAYTAYGATITPAVFAIFLMRNRLTKAGGVTGMIIGFIISVSWETILGQPLGLDAVIIAAPAAAIAIIAVSMLTRDRSSGTAVSASQDR